MTFVECGFKGLPGEAGAGLLVLVGPTITVNIGFDPAFVPGGDHPTLPPQGLSALVDTGATESCIDNSVAVTLGLPAIDRRKIAGVHGAHEVNVYLAQIHFPALEYTIYGPFAGVDLLSGGQAHYAIIGRTFLRNMVMIYDGPTGSVVITQRNTSDPAPMNSLPVRPIVP